MEPLIPIPGAGSQRHRDFKQTHPGLLLDKLVPSLNVDKWQEMQKTHLEQLAECFHQQEGLKKQWAGYVKRVQHLWATQGNRMLRLKTTAPVVMHISRDSALENAGLCLHPVYGVPLLPGSGLKGMARSWAVQQGEPLEAITRIFGPDHEDKLGAQRGSVCFFDAIPQEIPRLEVDIVNNHHGKYYDKPGHNPPGDWESPVPVYFLAVSPGAEFTFAVTGPEADTTRALGYLASALRYLGAGAKTNAGYGHFALENTRSPTPAFTESSTHALKLVSPGFFAGASQQAEDCRLRAASLRGVLRSWWRTLHTAHLASQELGELEAAIFGSAKQAGALQLQLKPLSLTQPTLFDQDKMVKLLDGHHARPSDRKTTFGLYYVSYGMDVKKRDKRTGQDRQRHYLPAGASWHLEFHARDVKQGRFKLSAAQVLQQAQSALWLLCHYGGVGAKSRKGFGAFAGLAGTLVEQQDQAARLRQQLGLSSVRPKLLALSIDAKLPDLDIETPWTDPFFVIHRLGESMQAFAKRYKRQGIKKALGLPRRVGENHDRSKMFFRPDSVVKDRHTSPVHVHLELLPTGNYRVRLAFLIAGALPNPAESKAFLSEYRAFIAEDFAARLARKEPANLKAKRENLQHEAQREAKAAATPDYKTGDKVQIRLTGQNKKGTWKGLHEASGYTGSVVNSKEVTADWSEGQSVEVEIASITAVSREMSFRWKKPS